MAAPASRDATENNNRLFRTYSKKLSQNDVTVYELYTGKLVNWLRDEKAYYTAARPEILRLLLTAQKTLRRNVGFDTNPAVAFNITNHLQHPMAAPYIQLVKAVQPFVHCFEEPDLRGSVKRIIQSTLPEQSIYGTSAPLSSAAYPTTLHHASENASTTPFTLSARPTFEGMPVFQSSSLSEALGPPSATVGSSGIPFQSAHTNSGDLASHASQIVQYQTVISTESRQQNLRSLSEMAPSISAAHLSILDRKQDTSSTPLVKTAPATHKAESAPATVKVKVKKKGRLDLSSLVQRDVAGLRQKQGHATATTPSNSIPVISQPPKPLAVKSEPNDSIVLAKGQPSAPQVSSHTSQAEPLSTMELSARSNHGSADFPSRAQYDGLPVYEVIDLTLDDSDEESRRCLHVENKASEALSAKPMDVAIARTNDSTPIAAYHPQGLSELHGPTEHQNVNQLMQLPTPDLDENASARSALLHVISEPSGSRDPSTHLLPTTEELTALQSASNDVRGEGQIEYPMDMDHPDVICKDELEPSSEPLDARMSSDVEEHTHGLPQDSGLVGPGPIGNNQGVTAVADVQSNLVKGAPAADVIMANPQVEDAGICNTLPQPGSETASSHYQLSFFAGHSESEKAFAVQEGPNDDEPPLEPHPVILEATPLRAPPFQPSTNDSYERPSLSIVTAASISHNAISVDFRKSNTDVLAPCISDQAIPLPDLSVLSATEGPVTSPRTGNIFGKDMRVVTILQGLTSSCKISVQVDIPEEEYPNLLKWVDRNNHDADIDKSLCLSLGCYSSTAIIEQSKKQHRCSEEIVSTLYSSWPTTGGLTMKVQYKSSRQELPLSPPFVVTADGLVDISQFISPGLNVIELIQYRDLASYTFVLHAHHPTYSQLEQVRKKREKDKEWHDWLGYVSRPFNIPIGPVSA